MPINLSLGNTRKSLCLYTPYTPLLIFLYSNEIPLEPLLLQDEQFQLSQSFLMCQILHPPTHLSSCLLDSAQHIYVFLALESPELYPALQMKYQQCQSEGRITSLDLLATLQTQPRGLLIIFATRAYQWLTACFGSNMTLRASSAQLRLIW